MQRTTDADDREVMEIIERFDVRPERARAMAER